MSRCCQLLQAAACRDAKHPDCPVLDSKSLGKRVWNKNGWDREKGFGKGGKCDGKGDGKGFWKGGAAADKGNKWGKVGLGGVGMRLLREDQSPTTSMQAQGEGVQPVWQDRAFGGGVQEQASCGWWCRRSICGRERCSKNAGHQQSARAVVVHGVSCGQRGRAHEDMCGLQSPEPKEK